MKSSWIDTMTGAAVIAGAAALGPAALGANDRDADALATARPEELAQQRELEALRTPPPDEADRDSRNVERGLALDRLARAILRDTEQCRADCATSGPALSLDFSDAVRLGAFQDEAGTEDPGGLEAADPYQERIDYDGDGDGDESDLARAAQNPIADLVSLPFQNNLSIDVGRLNYEQNVLNIQPVIPFNLSEELNLITRTIVPVVYQPAFASGDDHDFGISDTQFTAFLAPTKTFGGWIIGGGPVFRLPTSTDERLGARKWTVGPSAVALRIDGPWLFGGLFQQVWSVAGSGDQNVSEFLFQPFINYNIPDGKGWYLTTSPIITANWMADSDNEWTVPLGGGVGRVFRIGDQPVNCSLQAFHNVEKPEFLGDWTIRFQVQLLFPR
jgi:hypothetical protein